MDLKRCDKCGQMKQCDLYKGLWLCIKCTHDILNEWYEKL
jgi:ribosomal protein L37AE/L43A